jgi:hypothetical protein
MPRSSLTHPAACSSRPRRAQAVLVMATATGTQQDGSRTIMQKNTPGEMPFPWSEKDPYRLPVAIERVQQHLVAKGACRGTRHLRMALDAVQCCRLGLAAGTHSAFLPSLYTLR